MHAIIDLVLWFQLDSIIIQRKLLKNMFKTVETETMKKIYPITLLYAIIVNVTNLNSC